MTNIKVICPYKFNNNCKDPCSHGKEHIIKDACKNSECSQQDNVFNCEPIIKLIRKKKLYNIKNNIKNA